MSMCCCSLAGTVACDHCRNRSMTFEYSAGTTYSSEDFDFPKKKQTNADRFRAKSDEELADWLDRNFACRRHEGCLAEKCCNDTITCRQAWLKWLKQEADT